MLQGFGPSESALAREGLMLGIAVSKVGGCPKSATREPSEPKVAGARRSPRRPKVGRCARRCVDEAEGLHELPKVQGSARRSTADPKVTVVPSG